MPPMSTPSSSSPSTNKLPIFALVVAVGAALAVVFFWTGRNQTPKTAPAATTPTSPATPQNANQDSAKAAEVLAAAEKLLAQGESGKAESILKAAAVSFPSDQGVVVALAELLVANRRLDEAYEAYERALAIGPRDATLEFAAGTVATMLDKTDRAIEHYSAAQAADKADPRFPLYLAQVQAKANLVTEAKANLLIAGKLDPDNAVVWGTLADLSLREGQVSLALQHIAKARTLQPTVVVWRIIEARAMKRDNRPEDALGVLIGLTPTERLEPGVLSTMSECYGFLGRPADAAKLYEEAVKAEPMDGELTLEWALWLERAGQKEEALVRAERAKLLLAKGADEVVERLKKP